MREKQCRRSDKQAHQNSQESPGIEESRQTKPHEKYGSKRRGYYLSRVKTLFSHVTSDKERARFKRAR